MGPILAITAPANGSGKTTLACRILEAFPKRFVAVKSITVYREGKFCPSHTGRCACKRLEGDFAVVVDEEVIAEDGTDTGRMLRAGALATLWGLARPGSHSRLWEAMAPILPQGAPILLEGSGASEAARAAGTLLVFAPEIGRRRWKPDTPRRVATADLVLVNSRAGSGECEENLDWLLAARPDARAIDLTRPLAETPQSWLHDWVAGFLTTP